MCLTTVTVFCFVVFLDGPARRRLFTCSLCMAPLGPPSSSLSFFPHRHFNLENHSSLL
jgi:hypothetical protein